MSGATWIKMPAIEGRHGGCLNCGVRPSFFPADGVIAVGFGYAALLKDGQEVWSEPSGDHDWEELLTGERAEQMALSDPDHDWQIVMEGPLSGRTYQRHGPSEWALVEQNQGFA